MSDDSKGGSETHKILIVDDNPNNLSVLDNFLKESGFTTLIATKGELALKRAEFTIPDLILLDVMMPGIDGFETCRRLKADAATKDIPVIFTTALSSTEDKVRGFEVGGVDYITKPFQAEEVLARVETHLTLRNLRTRLEAQNIRLQKEIDERMESIEYAQKIQHSLLPDPEAIRQHIPESFFLWMPRDVVGGDLFITEFWEDAFLIAVIDCTGHGVPGALMTMLASTGYHRVISEDCRDPALMLQRLNVIVKETLHQDTDTTHGVSDDGLDAAICLVIPKEHVMTFAGARLPLYVASHGEVTLIKGDKQSVGYRRSDAGFEFSSHTIEIGPDMRFYLATDGFADQVGGEKGFPFGNKRFLRLLKEQAEKPFEQQREALMEAFNTYKGDHQRRDDVTVVGFGF